MATKIAQYSGSPAANWFQINTMAMHRASPTMITPLRYRGRSDCGDVGGVGGGSGDGDRSGLGLTLG